jgi:hypothetical protein
MTVPSYRAIPGTNPQFLVDAFRYRPIQHDKVYFLTHAHSGKLSRTLLQLERGSKQCGWNDCSWGTAASDAHSSSVVCRYAKLSSLTAVVLAQCYQQQQLTQQLNLTSVHCSPGHLQTTMAASQKTGLVAPSTAVR